MELQFNQVGKRWEAELLVEADFNLHIERPAVGALVLSQRGSESGAYDTFHTFSPYDLVIDYDVQILVYKKFIKISSEVEPTYAALTTSGEVTEIKSQSKEVEIVSNGTTEISPDAGYAYLNSVKVKTNVPQEGGGGGNWRYFDVSNVADDTKMALIEVALLARMDDNRELYVLPFAAAKEAISFCVAFGYDADTRILFGGSVVPLSAVWEELQPIIIEAGAYEITEEEFYNLES